MDAISYAHSAKQAQRIEKFIENPDSTSGVLTQPSVIQTGETVTVPTGRTAILANTQIDGTLTVDGTVFIPSGATLDGVVEKVTSTDNAIVRFNGVTGEVQNSGVIIDDAGNVGVGVTPSAIGRPSIQIENVVLGQNSTDISNMHLMSNAYRDGANIYSYISSGASARYQHAGGTHQWSTAPSGTAGNPITWTQQMMLDASANLTVGDASMSGTRSIAVQSGTLGNDQLTYVSARGGTAGVINRYASIGIRKHSGITNACGYLNIYSQNGGNNYIWTDDLVQLRISQTASHLGTTNGTVVGTQTSDERVKNIVGTCPYGLQEILDLETYKYSMKDDVEGSYKLGFVAQQAMGVIPESVYDTNERLTEAVTVTKQKVVKEAVKDEEGNVLEPEVLEDYEDVEYQETSDTVTKLAMDYQMMIPVLVNAVKEQQELINSLTARLDRLEGNL